LPRLFPSLSGSFLLIPLPSPLFFIVLLLLLGLAVILH